MNYVIASYIIVWVVFFAYVFYLGRRIAMLEREVANLKK